MPTQGLYSGFGATLMRDIPEIAIQFALYEHLKAAALGYWASNSGLQVRCTRAWLVGLPATAAAAAAAAVVWSGACAAGCLLAPVEEVVCCIIARCFQRPGLALADDAAGLQGCISCPQQPSRSCRS